MFQPGDTVRGLTISVLGAGRSGLAVSALLAGQGASVLLSDMAEAEKIQERLNDLQELGVQFEFGGHTERIYEVDLMVISPGIPVEAPVVRKAKAKEIPVFGELEVASWFNTSRMIAVTGSNGKSTVTTLIGEILKDAGKQSVVAGNIGTSFAGEVQNTRPDGFAVLEVSNFQLETVDRFHPEIAVFLNLTPDHLDRHGSMENYGKIKARIFENQTSDDWLISNAKDQAVKQLCDSAPGRLACFGKRISADACAFVQNGKLGLSIHGVEETLLPISELGICGEHNVLNALAAALSARLVGVDAESINSTLRRFRGLPHRLEFVRELRGVRWINDSKATNVDSVRYALGSYDAPLIWIAGGRDKDSDFTQLTEAVRDSVKSAILIGEAAEKMAAAFKEICPVFLGFSLNEAVRLAGKQAVAGDVVLLSPACASFDMFENFEDRGDQFKQQVQKLS